MVRFTAFVFSTWIAHAGGAVNTQSRNLNMIAGYTPSTKVTDQNAFDRDEKYMEKEMAKKTVTGFANARAIYEEGGNSMSYAFITLGSDLESEVLAGTVVVGSSIYGGKSRGTVYENAAGGQRTVLMQYDTSQYQDTWVMCRVGALTDGVETSGCLQDTGSITIGDKELSYTYNSLLNNDNGRTLQSISTDVQSKMIDCTSGCPFQDAQWFKDYYGTASYGNEWITAAFEKRATSFTNGNADFSVWADSNDANDDARIEVIKKGTVCMNVFMNVVRAFEESLIHCTTECNSSDCENDPVAAWDAGVALYTGSEEKTDGFPGGVFLHQLADTRCGNFKTCGPSGGKLAGETSYINGKLLRLFEMGQTHMLNRQCSAATTTVKSIVKHMYIPIIQGTLRYAFVTDRLSQGPKVRAEGAVFAAAVLPRIHAISPPAAKVIYENMRVGVKSTSFIKVKAAFESTYSDLGITCAKVGGLVDSVGDYRDDARPCKDGESTPIVDNDDDDGKPATTNKNGAVYYTWGKNNLMLTAFVTIAVTILSM